MQHQFLNKAIHKTGQELLKYGKSIHTDTWHAQDIKDKPEYQMWELLKYSFEAHIPLMVEELRNEVHPNLPWADLHFDERVSRIPYNPPPSHEIWPFNKNKNSEHLKGQVFSHTYPERYWPKIAGIYKTIPNGRGYSIGTDEDRHRGIRFNYGDLDDVVNLLYRDQNTRQAYLPVWFPEDTGAVEKQRVPCSLGYHFIVREGMLHCIYYMRSCDYLRHFRDDIYLTCRLVIWVLSELRKKAEYNNIMPDQWKGILPGILTMHITSLHIFEHEKRLIK